MTENVDSIVLEQLRAIRSEMAEMRHDMGEMKEKLSSIDAGQKGLMVIVANLAGNIHDLEERVERLEAKVGA